MTDPSRRPFSRAESTVLRAAIERRSSPGAWPTYVARQPVFDRDLHVVAYELLFRGAAAAEEAFVVDAQAATGEAALTAMSDIGLDTLVAGKRALVNVSRAFLLEEQVLALPPDRVALEVLESVEPDAAVVARLRELSGLGYQIVLDDFVLDAETRALLDVANFVKVDVKAHEEAGIAQLVRDLREHPVRLLAEKIEHPDMLQFCRDLGFEYFQGFVFGGPQVMTGRRIRPAQLTVLRLLNALARPDVTLAELEAIIVQDVGLSVTLLRYLNSAAIGLIRRVGSIRDAIIFLGTDTIRCFACLVSLTAHSQQPAELARIGMIRAKMMELMAAALGHPDPPGSFTVGLLSVADALLEVPMEIMLEELDELALDLQRALATRDGEFGALLRGIESYEHGRLHEIDRTAIDPALLRDSYLRAVEWADESATCLIPLTTKVARRDPLRRAS
jgi:c-di-GMP-related signal transduction protein